MNNIPQALIDATEAPVAIEELETSENKMPAPYEVQINLNPIIEHYEKIAENEDLPEASMARVLLEAVAKKPALRAPISEEELVGKYKEEMNLLFTAIADNGQHDSILTKISAPFAMTPLYFSPMARKLHEGADIHYRISLKGQVMECAVTVWTSALILKKVYGYDLRQDPPILFSIKKQGESFNRYYKIFMDDTFIQVVPTKPVKPLTEEDFHLLASSIHDQATWLEVLPPDAFRIEGVAINHLVEVTEEETLSELKLFLLRPNAVTSRDKLKELQPLMESFLGINDLKLGITAIDYPLSRMVPHEYKIRFDLLADKVPLLLDPQYDGSIYHEACKTAQPVLIEDLRKRPEPTELEKMLLKKGIRSIIVAPLLDQHGQVIGILEIGDKRPYGLNSFLEGKITELVSLIGLAVSRSRNEVDNQLEAIIRSEYTAVHPSVEWRFMQAAFNRLEADAAHTEVELEPIVFHDVHPLYGQADIVSSSTKRNRSIQSDLIHNLELAEKLMMELQGVIPFPLLGQLEQQAAEDLAALRKEFNSNDESRLVDFLTNHIHPVLRQVQTRFPQTESLIQSYFAELDADLGIIYRDRKDYEESVQILNKEIAAYIDKQQPKWQSVIPHYFERYQTDGVEYDMYVGQELLNNQQFDPIFLKNFRLWQIEDMIEITQRVHNLQSKLPVPLTTAQLIFVYNSTLSIRFREDEKQFDVDGAYNVRYEILKKRIDKAVIDGSVERLTQPGKIAIVYLQDKDRAEYLEYLEYLVKKGLLDPNIEDLTLGKLQGAQGLKALRVRVVVE